MFPSRNVSFQSGAFWIEISVGFAFCCFCLLLWLSAMAFTGASAFLILPVGCMLTSRLNSRIVFSVFWLVCRFLRFRCLFSNALRRNRIKTKKQHGGMPLSTTPIQPVFRVHPNCSTGSLSLSNTKRLKAATLPNPAQAGFSPKHTPFCLFSSFPDKSTERNYGQEYQERLNQ